MVKRAVCLTPKFYLKFYVGMGRYIGDQGNFRFASLPLTKLFKFIRFSYLCLHLSGLETVYVCLSDCQSHNVSTLVNATPSTI